MTPPTGIRSGEVHAHADRERRKGKAALRAQLEKLIDDDDTHADDCTQTQEAPVLSAAHNSLSQRRNQRGLRGCKCILTCSRSSLETESVLHEVQDRRNDQSTKNNTDDQRDLLLPGSCTHELTSLKVLQIIVRNRCDTEDNRGGKEGVGDEGSGFRAGRTVSVNGNDCQSS